MSFYSRRPPPASPPTAPEKQNKRNGVSANAQYGIKVRSTTHGHTYHNMVTRVTLQNTYIYIFLKIFLDLNKTETSD